jgi:chromosomal replication initiator protein
MPMNSAAEIWERVLSILKQNMTETTISTWFSDIEPVALDENRFILSVPTEFKRDILISRYAEDIKRALYDLFSADLDVVILGEEGKTQFQKPEAPSRFLPGTEEYTFERFVVGNSNKLAHAAALAVAEHPAENYNPLFIHGESGLGKTHLLYAIAHTIHKNHPDYKIVYIRGEDFTNELIRDIRAGKNQEFRDKYRSADVFLMDDVQFIAGRDSTQEEMFHTFNTLYEDKKQIVFTADRPPKEMLRLEDRLKTRFEWGLLADIQPPDYETRMAILQKKADQENIIIDPRVLSLIATKANANIRQLEGAFTRVVAFSKLLGTPITLSMADSALKDIIEDVQERRVTVPMVQQVVADFYSVSVDAMTSSRRTADVTYPRQVAMYLSREMTDLSLKAIGEQFGGRNYSTIISACNKIEDDMRFDPELSKVFKDLKKRIKGN